MKNIILRHKYLEKLKQYKNKPIVKVIIGQRRTGKSFLLKQLIQEIETKEKDSNVIYINKEDIQFEFIKNSNDLHKFIINRCENEILNYVFIDEIQEIFEFEKAIRSLQLIDNLDIYCTGSNAKMLSGELATHLSGRYIEIPVHSLSFLEFLEFHKLKNNSESLQMFLKYGGMPFLRNLSLTDELVFDYLKGIYNTIIYCDVIKRHEIRNVGFFETLIIFLSENIGQLFSATSISNFIKSQKTNISVSQIINYLKYLNDSFIISKVNRFDIVGKKIFEIGEKYYFEDLGLRNTIFEFKQADIAKIMENVVYNHLKYCGYDLKVGYFNQTEVDFLARKNGETIYVQVCYLLQNQDTIEREFGNLLAIKDNYMKIVVSMDEFKGNSYNGIQHINLREFLSKIW